jgi:hypothetical protein
MLTNMVFNRTTQQFPDLKTISAHGGGTIPYLITLLQTLEQVLGPGAGRSPLTPEEIREVSPPFTSI